MRDKMKGLMKKVNSPFASSSPAKFKGQGRVLGSTTPSSSQSQSLSSSSSLLSNSKPSPQKVNTISEQKLENRKTETRVNPNAPEVNAISEQKLENRKTEIRVNTEVPAKSESGFDPFDSLITSGKRNPNGYSLKVFECPICGAGYTSEEEVSAHVESCLSKAESINEGGKEESNSAVNQLLICVDAYVFGKPSDGSKEVLIRILRNMVKEPENAKFRKIRLGNPKIKEAIGDVSGGVELLESVGFELKEEGGEMWLVMEEPSEEQLGLLKKAIILLEPKKSEEVPSTAPVKLEEPIERKPVDRQV